MKYKRLCLILLFSCLTVLAKNQSRNLEFYLKEGLQNSPLLNDYRNQINSTASDSLLIKAAKKPLVEAKSQLQYSPVYDNFGYDEVITDGGNYTAVLGVSQKIFNKKELDNKYESVGLQKLALGNSATLSVNELNKLITDQYLTAFSVYSDLLFNRKFLKLSRDENDIVAIFVKNGVCKQTDYLSLVLETQSQDILVNQLDGQFRKEQILLNKLCGLNDTVFYNLEEPRIEIRGMPDIVKSPGFIQYKIDSMRIENEKTAIDIRYKPKVNWFADAGFLTSNPWNFYQHFGYSAGISLNFPVYDGKQKVIEKQKLEFNENSRRNYEERFRKQYFQQIQQLYEELKTLNKTSEQTESQLATSDQLVKALKDQLEKGIILMTEYINAIKNFRTINRNLILVEIRKLQVINEMNYLLTK
jgi:outer membrane protein TolC